MYRVMQSMTRTSQQVRRGVLEKNEKLPRGFLQNPRGVFCPVKKITIIRQYNQKPTNKYVNTDKMYQY